MADPRENPAFLDDERLQPASPLDDSVPPPVVGRRVSDETNIHDEGSDANDTEDGLFENQEAARQAAEDIPIGRDPAGSQESVPVFDRASLPPKV